MCVEVFCVSVFIAAGGAGEALCEETKDDIQLQHCDKLQPSAGSTSTNSPLRSSSSRAHTPPLQTLESAANSLSLEFSTSHGHPSSFLGSFPCSRNQESSSVDHPPSSVDHPPSSVDHLLSSDVPPSSVDHPLSADVPPSSVDHPPSAVDYFSSVDQHLPLIHTTSSSINQTPSSGDPVSSTPHLFQSSIHQPPTVLTSHLRQGSLSSIPGNGSLSSIPRHIQPAGSPHRLSSPPNSAPRSPSSAFSSRSGSPQCTPRFQSRRDSTQTLQHTRGLYQLILAEPSA